MTNSLEDELMPKFKALPSAEALRAEFHYDKETGVLSRKTREGLVTAGCVSTSGYLQVGFGGPGQIWSGHRLIWKLVTGEDPGMLEVDHINRVRHDNRWDNLRLVTRDKQMINRGVLRTSSTGLKGAYVSNKRKGFKSAIMRNGVSVHLGYFDSAEAAHNAYIAAGGTP